MTFSLVGLLIKGLRMSILIFFLTISILIHCYYVFFTRLNVTLYWNLCYPIIPRLWINVLPVLCFSYKSLVLLHYFSVIKVFTFLIYLYMPIDNLIWHARVGIFNSSKPLFKTKIKNRGMLQLLLHHTVYSLYLFLTFILIK